MTGLAYVLALVTSLGLAQCLAGWILVTHFASRATLPPVQLPPVSVLKPLCGDEPLLEEALASCCNQTYPAFEIVFGVQDMADPALAVVQRLRDRFPRCDIVTVVDDTPHGPNRKVANLINMLPSARHDVLVISDSDLHVMPNYLEQLVAALDVPGTGLVTAGFLGRPSRRTWAAQLGATQISHCFLPGVLIARAMGRQDCLGSTVMLQRQTLENIGGLRPLVDHLAEDNVLGQKVRGLGLTVRLASTVPVASVPETSIRALWQHEIRWARTIRGLAPTAYALSVIQYPLCWAALTFVFSGGACWSVALFTSAWAVRSMIAWGVDRALRPKLSGRASPAPYFLLPLRDVLSVVETILSYCGNKVVWRNHKLTTTVGMLKPAGDVAQG